MTIHSTKNMFLSQFDEDMKQFEDRATVHDDLIGWLRAWISIGTNWTGLTGIAAREKGDLKILDITI
jgi:hypothetical protein